MKRSWILFNIILLLAAGIQLQAQGDVVLTIESITDVSCGGVSDGAITVSVLGGTGDYSYLLLKGVLPMESAGPMASNTYTFTGHDKFANYTVMVSDEDPTNTDAATVAIGGPDPISITSAIPADVTCNGFGDGTITVTATGEDGTYTFVLTGTENHTNGTGFFPDLLPATDYVVTVTDDNPLCTSSDATSPLTINDPPVITITEDNVTDVVCYGDFTGSISITPDGGIPGGAGTGYTYSWSGPNDFTSTAEDIINVEAGDYFVTVFDNNMCLASMGPITVSQATQLTALLTGTTDVSCNGGGDGTASMTPGGGTGGYTFFWEGQSGGLTSTAQNPVNLEADTYNFTLSDADGCSRVFYDFAIISEPAPLDVTVTGTTDVSCPGGTDGSAEITPSGGTPPYSFAWLGATSGNSSSDEDPSGMPADDYSLTLSDNNGCSQLFTNLLTINQPDPIVATVNSTGEVSCYGGADGSADISVTGGTPGYTFTWTGDLTGHTSSMEDPNDLMADTYDLAITDNNGCPQLFNDLVTIGEPADLSVTVDNITHIDCNGDATGAIEITAAGGTPAYSFSWTGPNGYTAATGDISNLEEGNYSLVITDSHGCVKDFINVATVNANTAITATYLSQVDILCNGEAGGSIEIDADGGIAPLVFDWTDGSGTTVSTDEDPTGLTAGSYSLDISDALGCSTSFPDLATITEPPPVTIALAGTDIVCYGDGDGTITVTASGGTGPYEYSRLGDLDAAYGSGFLFSNLGPGLYTIWTRDVNKCAISDTITIHEPLEIQILGETKSGQNLCHGDSLGQISIDAVSGGTQPYLYSINGGVDFFTTHVFTNLPAGNYQTVVRDASGCETSGNLNVISQPSMLRIDSYVQEDISTCHEAFDGRIVLSGSGGSGVITYTLNDTLVNPAGDFQNLPAGPHKVTMEDGNSCTRDTTFVILAPPAIVVDMVSLTHVTGCTGDASGKVAVTGSGGTGTLSYNIDGGAFKPNGNFIKLLSGNHTVTLMDDNGCTLDTVVTLTEPEPIVIDAAMVTQIDCAGANDGMIEVTASGGTPPLNYTLNPGGTTDPEGSFSGLSPGTYTVSVEDAAGCGPVDTSPLILADPPLFNLDSIQNNSISCNGAGDGSISIYARGGVRPYTYSVDNQVTWGTDSVITGLAPGSYEVYTRDANGCVAYGGPVTMTDPPVLTLSVTATDITTCAGDNTGSLEATGGGGTGSLEYSLNDVDYQSSGTFINLPGGGYTVYLRDEKGCTLTEQATINEPAPILATITKTDVTYDNLGSITISGVTNGNPPYEYSIRGPGGVFSAVTVYLDLSAGTYHVIARDVNGCTFKEMVEVMDDPPLHVVVNVAHASCYDTFDGSIEFIPQDAEGAVEYSINNGLTFVSEALFENLMADSTYLLMGRDAAGKVFSGSVTITRPTELILSDMTSSWANCNAFSETGSIDVTLSGGSGSYTYLWSDGSRDGDRPNIVAGTYILQTTDENGCTRTDTFTVNSKVTVNANAGKDTTICYGTSLQLNAGGGDIASWSPATFLSHPDSVTTMANGVTEPITYVLTLSENSSPYGCYNTDTVIISLHPLTGLEVTPDTTIAQWTSAQLEAVGGPFSTYRWEPAEGLDNSTIPNPVASPGSSTLYRVYATNELGCEETDSVLVTVNEEIRAYNVFSPNGDGINDYFEIENIDIFPDVVVEIYSRWGDLLFSTTGYDDGSRWDGTTRDKEAPLGTYYYVIIPYSGAKPITGNVTIIR